MRLAKDVDHLVAYSLDHAKRVMTPDFVRGVAKREGYALRDEQVDILVANALSTIEQTVRNQRVELNSSDYKEILRRDIIG